MVYTQFNNGRNYSFILQIPFSVLLMLCRRKQVNDIPLNADRKKKKAKCCDELLGNGCIWSYCRSERVKADLYRGNNVVKCKCALRTVNLTHGEDICDLPHRLLIQ